MKRNITAEEIRHLYGVLLATSQFDMCPEVFWRHADDGFRFYVKCEELFVNMELHDEEITVQGLEVLKMTWRDLESISETHANMYVSELYCARMRGRMPSKRWMSNQDLYRMKFWPKMKELFLQAPEYRQDNREDESP